MYDTYEANEVPDDLEERIQYFQDTIEGMTDREVAEWLEYAFSIDKLVVSTNLEEIV